MKCTKGAGFLWHKSFLTLSCSRAGAKMYTRLGTKGLTGKYTVSSCLVIWQAKFILALEAQKVATIGPLTKTFPSATRRASDEESAMSHSTMEYSRPDTSISPHSQLGFSIQPKGSAKALMVLSLMVLIRVSFLPSADPPSTSHLPQWRREAPRRWWVVRHSQPINLRLRDYILHTHSNAKTLAESIWPV